MRCDCEYNHRSCVKRVPVFSGLDDGELERVASLIEHKEYARKEVLFREEEPLHRMLIVRYGKVKLVRYGVDGEDILLDFLSPGDFYGGHDLFTNSVCWETGIALEDTGVCLLEGEKLRSLVLRNPGMALKIIEYLNTRVNQDRKLLEIFSIRNAEKKVAMYLAEHSRRQGSDLVQISQEDMGSVLGITKETVNRKLSALQEKGLIALEGHRKIRVVDKSRLTTV